MKYSGIRHVCLTFPPHLDSQTDAVLSSHSGEVLPTVQCHEDGPRPPRTPLGDRAAERQRPGLRRVRHLQRRAGKQTVLFSLFNHIKDPVKHLKCCF